MGVRPALAMLPTPQLRTLVVIITRQHELTMNAGLGNELR